MQASTSSWDLKTRLNWGSSLAFISPKEKSEVRRRGLGQWRDHHPKRPRQITQAPAAQRLDQKQAGFGILEANLVKLNPTRVSKPPMKTPA